MSDLENQEINLPLPNLRGAPKICENPRFSSKSTISKETTKNHVFRYYGYPIKTEKTTKNRGFGDPFKNRDFSVCSSGPP